MVVNSSELAFKRVGLTYQFCLFFMVGLSVIIGSGLCRAEMVSVGSTEISIPLPLSHCVLSNSNPAHSRLIEYYRNAAEKMDQFFLLGSADCQQLEDWVNGRLPTLNDWASVFAPRRWSNEIISMDIEEFIATLRQEYINLGAQGLEERMKQTQSDITSALEKVFSGASIGEIKPLGILDQDENALYIGLALTGTTEYDQPKQTLSITALTLIRGKYVHLELDATYHDADTIYRSLRKVKDWSHRAQLNN